VPRYFTPKVPGLFVLVADMQGVSGFEIEGNLGAGGFGVAEGIMRPTSSSGATTRTRERSRRRRACT